MTSTQSLPVHTHTTHYTLTNRLSQRSLEQQHPCRQTGDFFTDQLTVVATISDKPHPSFFNEFAIKFDASVFLHLWRRNDQTHPLCIIELEQPSISEIHEFTVYREAITGNQTTHPPQSNTITPNNTHKL